MVFISPLSFKVPYYAQFYFHVFVFHPDHELTRLSPHLPVLKGIKIKVVFISIRRIRSTLCHDKGIILKIKCFTQGVYYMLYLTFVLAKSSDFRIILDLSIIITVEKCVCICSYHIICFLGEGYSLF